MTGHRIAIAEIVLALCFAAAIVAGSFFFDLSPMGTVWLLVGYVLAAGLLRAFVMARTQ
jgi:hypothetical protein